MGRLKRFTEKIRRSFAKYKKPIVSLSLALSIFCTGSMIYAYICNTKVDPAEMGLFLTENGVTHTTGYKYANLPSGEHVAYCLDPNKGSPRNTDYIDGGSIDQYQYNVLGWAYPSYHYTGCNNVDYFISQCAVWHATGVINWSNCKVLVGKSYYYNQDCTADYKDNGNPKWNNTKITAEEIESYIENLASCTGVEEKPHFNFNTGGEFPLYGNDPNYPDDYVSGWMDVKVMNNAWGAKNVQVINVYSNIEGTELITETGKKSTPWVDKPNNSTFSWNGPGEKFYIKIPKANVSDPNSLDVHLDFKINYTGWSPVSTRPVSDGGRQPLAYIIKNGADAEGVTYAKLQDTPTTPKGGVRIRKVDEEGKPLAGAEFTLSGGTLSAPIKAISGSDGWAVWKEQKLGTYTIKETKAPTGYSLSSETWTAEVTEDKTKTLEFKCVDKKEDTPKQEKFNVKLHKVDENGQSLAGAEFTLHNKTGSYSLSKTTDSTGKLEWTDVPIAVPSTSTGNTSGSVSVGDKDGSFSGSASTTVPVPEGENEFILEETKAPEGYEISMDKKEINPTNGSTEDYSYEIVNKPSKKYGWVELYKIDPQHVKLEGVGFALIEKATGKTIQTGKTDWRGYLKFIDVPYEPEGTDYIVKETEPLPGFAFLESDWEFTLKDGHESYSKTIQNNPKYYQGSVTIVKRDKDNEIPLPGATIALFDSNGKQIGVKTTGGDGKVIFDNLDLGEYWYQEIKAPAGYHLDPNKYKLEITERHLDAESILPNKKYGAVDIYKVDYDKEIPLEGVKFGLYDKDKHLLKEGITNGNGHVIFDELEIGTYYIKELQALPGFQLDPDFHMITLSDNNRYYRQTVTNKKYGSITLHKIDDVGNPLEGAYFQLYDKDMKPVGEPKKSQGNGKVIWDHLELGQYYIKETEAPQGYQIGQFTKGIEITERHRDEEINVSNQIIYGSLTIVKTNENDHSLRGAEFAIYNDEGILLETKKTTTNGTVIFEHLPVGYYTIVETNPPEGYIPISENVTVKGEEVMNCEITMRHLDQQIYIANKPIVGNVHIIKTDSTDKHKLGDAIFALYDDKGHEIASAKTDDWGEAWFRNIKYGKYTMKEVACPIGYEQNDTVYEVNICEDGVTLEYQIENKPITYKIQLHKDDIETGEVLEGAEFQLWQNGAPLSYNGKSTFTTDKNGQISFPFDLEYGEYELVETKAPYGYIASDSINIWLNETTTFHMDSLKNRVVDITAHNQSKRTVLKLTKIDEDTGLPLQNAKFEVWNEDRTQCVAKGETGPTGIAMFNLKLGTYWFKEVEAPEGYTIDTTWRQVIFDDTSYGLTQSFRVSNKQSNYTPPKGDSSITKEDFPSIQITKLDVSTGEPLPNAGFVIYAEDGETVVKRGMTDEDGIVTFQLNKGTFYYQEFLAPNGYEIDNQKYKFTLDENNQILKCEMTNHKSETHEIPKTPSGDSNITPETPSTPQVPTVTPDTPTGEVDICKTDISTGELLPNGTFFIYGADQKTVIVSGKTDETGIVRFKLPAGDYYYQEFSAPEGYEVDNSKFPFSIKDNGEIVKCRMTDVPKTKTTLPNTGDIIKNKRIVCCGAVVALFLATTVLVPIKINKSRKGRFLR